MKILYYLGAGASTPTLPVTNEFNKDIINLSQFLDVNYFKGKSISSHNLDKNGKPIDTRLPLLKDFENIANKAKDFASIDTYAKYLYLNLTQNNNIEELNKLKSIISIYFMLKQIKEPVEKKYETFLVTIADIDSYRNIIFPSNIKIITWNYDNQIELAIQKLLNKKELYEINNHIKIVPSEFNKTNNDDIFTLVKLNGSSSFFIENGLIKYYTDSDLFPNFKLT